MVRDVESLEAITEFTYLVSEDNGARPRNRGPVIRSMISVASVMLLATLALPSAAAVSRP